MTGGKGRGPNPSDDLREFPVPDLMDDGSNCQRSGDVQSHVTSSW
jgi:hypothetical protein